MSRMNCSFLPEKKISACGKPLKLQTNKLACQVLFIYLFMLPILTPLDKYAEVFH